MSLINQPTPPTPPTQEEIIASTVSQMKQIMTGQFNFRVRSFTQLYDLLWKTPGISPQDILNAFGTDAGELFKMAAQEQAIINAQVPGTLTQAPLQTVTINADGTVTLS